MSKFLLATTVLTITLSGLSLYANSACVFGEEITELENSKILTFSKSVNVAKLIKKNKKLSNDELEMITSILGEGEANEQVKMFADDDGYINYYSHKKNKKKYAEVVSYPGDNPYGEMFELTAEGPKTVAQIEDGAITHCEALNTAGLSANSKKIFNLVQKLKNYKNAEGQSIAQMSYNINRPNPYALKLVTKYVKYKVSDEIADEDIVEYLDEDDVQISDDTEYGTITLEGAESLTAQLIKEAASFYDENSGENEDTIKDVHEMLWTFEKLGARLGYNSNSSESCDGMNYSGLLIIDLEAGIIYDLSFIFGDC